MELLERHAPENYAGLMRLRKAWGTKQQAKVLSEVYPALPKTSVDYGVMEPASKDKAVSIVGVKMDVRWLDVGSWPSYGETLEPDAQGNRSAGATLAAHDSRGNLVIGDGAEHTVALVGCKDLIVIRTERATLVMPAGRAQDLKALHAGLAEGIK
jgi:mannose-1-phosphate guanylyltransferase